MNEPSRTITHSYEAALTWTGNEGTGTSDYRSYGRSYTVAVAGKPDLRGSADPAFRGDAALHNPEDLLVAAIAGCHMLSYLSLCARRGIRVIAYEDRASGVLSLEGGGGRFTDVELNPVVTVAGGADLELAERLHETAHEQCFIASSVSVPIRCRPTIRTEATRE
jgi:organic hydroperoxide reductase OsmC/OhrA